MRTMKLFLAGQWSDGSDTFDVVSPFDGRVVSSVARGGPSILEAAAAAAERAAPVLAATTPARRADILDRTAQGIKKMRKELAGAICEEAGKPISLARIEVDRCADTCAEAAAVARHPEVVSQDLGGYHSGEGRLALVRRVPIGPVLAITPFNFPLNLVAHKLAPAVAAGCPVVLKPASQTPSPALMLADILSRSGLPDGALSVIPSRGADAQALADDDRFSLLTFTGSAEVGRMLQKLAWKRRVTLELGGNAAVVVEPDIDDIEDVARRIAQAAFAYAGQSCISVQRILVHEDIYVAMRRALVDATEMTVWGDPAKKATICGPLIDDANAGRVVSWIEQAREAGGRLLTGGDRRDSIVTPTLLEKVPADQPLAAEEAFGPVAVLDPYEDLSQALLMVNDSRYGLQAGIFSHDIRGVHQAWQELEVGGVIHDDVPTWRTDPMPYGGVKASGVGREGPIRAYREMTEERMLILRKS